MNLNSLRKTLTFLCLAAAFAASVAYDSLFIQKNDRLQVPLAAIMAACFAAVFLLQQYPRDVIQPLVVAAWPLHLFTVTFVGICFVFHRGAGLSQVVTYTLFAYATYVLVPLLFFLDRQMLRAFVKLVALASGLLAIPSLFGAIGMESFLGIPLRLKFSYAEFSGIIASAGVFEHAEGHALQMAIGLFCCAYTLRRSWSVLYAGCFLLALAGLVVSQGRAAIYGVAIAVLFSVLPELFRRSRPVFLGSLFVALTFPFLIVPQLALIPGAAGYLRLDRGLSGRGEAWQFALELIEEKPWSGHGFMASTELTEAQQKTLRRSGFSGAGTTFHNTFISRAVDLGVIATLVYSLLYLVPLLRICGPSDHSREQALVRSMILLVLTTSLFRDYNVGGIRSTAMTGAIFLGLANLWPLAALWERGEQSAAAAAPEEEKPVSPNAANSVSPTS